MKKVLLTLGFIGAVACANAQVKSGTIMLGGEVSLSTSGGNDKSGGTTVDRPSTFDLNIVPKIGYYMTDNLALGLEIGYQSSNTTTPADNTTTPVTPEKKSMVGLFKVGPYVRWNMPFTDKFGFFLDGGVNLGFGSSSTSTGGTSVDGPKITALMIGIEPGFAYFVRSNFALEAKFGGLSYYTVSSKQTVAGNDVTGTSNGFALGLGTGTNSPAAGVAGLGSLMVPSLSLGFSFYFGNN